MEEVLESEDSCNSGVEVPGEVVSLRPEPIKDINLALTCKEKGNEHFRNKKFDESIDEYTQAISHCPGDEEHKDNLAVFLGNRAAAYFALEEYELVVEDCSEALKVKSGYVKVLVRRAQAYEKLDRLEEAISDFKSVRELDPTVPKINDSITKLEKLYEEKMAKLKDEALGKLKELGNSILGNFGMSLDNFKMTQDPATGSWSVSMNSGK